MRGAQQHPRQRAPRMRFDVPRGGARPPGSSARAPVARARHVPAQPKPSTSKSRQGTHQTTFREYWIWTLMGANLFRRATVAGRARARARAAGRDAMRAGAPFRFAAFCYGLSQYTIVDTVCLTPTGDCGMTVRFAVNSEVPVASVSDVDVHSRDAEVWVGVVRSAPGRARAAGVAVVAARPAGRLPPSGQRQGATSHRPLGSAGWQPGASGARARIERRPNDGEGERRTT